MSKEQYNKDLTIDLLKDKDILDIKVTYIEIVDIYGTGDYNFKKFDNLYDALSFIIERKRISSNSNLELILT